MMYRKVLAFILLTVGLGINGLIAQNQKISFFHPAVSAKGIIAFDSNLAGKNAVYVLTKEGGFKQISTEGYMASHPAWSSDGRYLSYESLRDGNFDIYVYDFRKKKELRFTDSDSVDAISQWRPDGHVIYESNRSGRFQMYQQAFGTREEARLITDKVEKVNYPVWSHSGKQVLFSTFFEGDMELCLSDAEFNKITRLTFSKGVDGWASWSADDEKIVFTSKRSGSNEIYLINPDGSGLERLTTDTENSAMPHFLPDGSGIIFMSRQGGEPSAIYSLDLSTRKQTKLTQIER
ncbi:MAG: hypothetical protein HEP71_30650 [Roseivirga sp.]|nr:hypothetical protein [Roseivirga sp.]